MKIQKNQQKIKEKHYKSIDAQKHEINESLVNDLLYGKIQKKMSSPKDVNNALFDMKSSPLINQTIANFKTLQNLFKLRKSPINYQNLADKLEIEKKGIDKLFDFSQEVEKINQKKNNFENLEPLLLENYYNLKESIDNKKLTEKKIRIFISNSQKKLVSEKNYVIMIILFHMFFYFTVRTITKQIAKFK